MDSSINTMMHAVRGYFRFAHIDGRIAADPAAAVRVEGYQDTLRGYRVLHLVGKGNKPATIPLTVPVLRVLEACRGERTEGFLVLRPVTGKPIDRRDTYRLVARIAKAASIPRHISPHSLGHAAITNALDAGVPLGLAGTRRTTTYPRPADLARGKSRQTRQPPYSHADDARYRADGSPLGPRGRIPLPVP